jgi:hypothetical protein
MNCGFTNLSVKMNVQNFGELIVRHVGVIPIWAIVLVMGGVTLTISFSSVKSIEILKFQCNEVQERLLTDTGEVTYLSQIHQLL